MSQSKTGKQNRLLKLALGGTAAFLASMPSHAAGINSFSASSDSVNVIFKMSVSGTTSLPQVYIDSDKDPKTGYQLDIK